MSSHGTTSKTSSATRVSSGSAHGSSEEDGEDQEESSSSSSLDNLNGTLSSFRIQWKKELKSLTDTKCSKKNSKVGLAKKSNNYSHDEGKNQSNTEDVGSSNVNSAEAKAKLLFRQGTEYEKSGRYYDAVVAYKTAMQLVPDIEFKIYSEQKMSHIDTHIELEQEEFSAENEVNEDDEEVEEKEDEYDGSEDLLSRFQRLLFRNNHLIIPSKELKTTNFSALPMEIVLYILRWVMSSHIDSRSIEMCSMVSRGFYICARDSELWKAACIKMWGLECENLIGSTYFSWREMYLSRPRLETIGCYISKTSYIRQGDDSFQDRTHHPWHVVTYFRYLRFFPGGLVLLVTTADPPSSVVGNLRWKNPKDSSILTGHYKLRDDRVFIVAVQSRQNLPANKGRSNRRRVNDYEPQDQTYNMEFKIQRRHKANMQLTWLDYSIVVRNHLGISTTTSFDTFQTKFPPYTFSRVKSYTSEADHILDTNY